MKSLRFVFFLTLLGCSTDDILVATLEADASADAASGDSEADSSKPADTGTPAPAEAGTPNSSDAALACRDRDDCPHDYLCAKTGCSGPGVCVLKPMNCGDEVSPVCDCEGITHLNDCVRRQMRRSFAYPGECGRQGRSCDYQRNERCAEGMVCVRLVRSRNDCAPNLPGFCWALGDCRMRDRFEQRFRVCGPPDGPGPGCVGLCEATETDRPLIYTEECRQ